MLQTASLSTAGSREVRQLRLISGAPEICACLPESREQVRGCPDAAALKLLAAMRVGEAVAWLRNNDLETPAHQRTAMLASRPSGCNAGSCTNPSA